MPVPFIDLQRQTHPLREDVLRAWADCFDRCEFVGGPRIGLLEAKLRAMLDVPHAIACANGTDALVIGLQALGVRPGMKVALPNLTFWATYEAVAQLGATPVLVDIDPDDLQMSVDELRSAHDRHRFGAAVLVHLYGWASGRLGEIRALCKERDILLLEDGAQCFGVQMQGRPVLSSAEVATLSFYPAKVVGGAMDGGAILVRDPVCEKLSRSLCNHGRSAHYSYEHVGWNSRMSGVQGAFLLRVLDEVPAILAARRKAARFYRDNLHGKKGIRVYGPPAGVEENGYLNVLTVCNRQGAELADALKQAGIGTGRTYPETIDAQPPAKSALRHGTLRHSNELCSGVLNLPLFYGIREDECALAADALLAIA
jgi:UDP-2-acetamido-2-deoxy-ribo-hexuluronate aminotransferase